MKVHLWVPGIAGFGGGIASFSREVALALQSLGHDLHLMSKLDPPGTWHSIPLRGAGNLPQRLQTPVFAAQALGSYARRRPAHVITTHLNFSPLAFCIKRLFQTPYTVVAHGIDVHEGLSSARLAGVRGAERVLAVSAWTRQRVLDLGGIDPERVAILPNTMDEARFAMGLRPEYLAARYKLIAGEKVVLTVARLDPAEGYKGYDRIVEALPAIRQACGPVRFVIAGAGGDRTRVEALARTLGVADALTFAGFVPDHELPDHYRLADAFALPSTGEGFGIVFLEAMACGTPVLAGNRDGSVDALDGGTLGQLVDPADVDAVARGIIALLRREGPAVWYEKQALRNAVVERFGRAAFLQTLRRVLPFQ